MEEVAGPSLLAIMTRIEFCDPVRGACERPNAPDKVDTYFSTPK